MPVATSIVCVECGGRAQLTTPIDGEDTPVVGDVIVYRCPECYGRFDVVVDPEDFDVPFE
jgi:hypothetical protein